MPECLNRRILGEMTIYVHKRSQVTVQTPMLCHYNKVLFVTVIDG